MERLAARGHQLQVGAGLEQISEPARSVDDLLEVVEDEKQALTSDVRGKTVLDSKYLRCAPEHELGITDGRERHPEDAVRIVVGAITRCLSSEASLAGAARAGEREQAYVVASEQLDDLSELALPAQEGGRRHGQLRAVERLEAGEVALTKLVDALGFRPPAQVGTPERRDTMTGQDSAFCRYAPSEKLRAMRRLIDRLRVPLVALRGVAASPDLRRIQLAYAGSEVGSWISIIALSVLSFDDGGLTGVGVVLGLRMLPPAIAAPFMGVLADRLPRRRVMIAADLVRVVLIGVAAAVLYADGPLLLVYALVSLVSIASTAFRPAQAAILPSLARTPDELTASNALSSTTESVMSFAGPALGGVLVAATDASTALVITALTFVWSAGLLLGVHEPERTASPRGDEPEASGILGELAVGAQTLVSDRRVGLLVGLIGAQVLVSGAFIVLLTGLVFDVLGAGDQGLGAILSALGIGGVLGAVVALSLVGTRLARSFAVGVVFWGVPIALLAVWQTSTGAFVLVAVIGFANTLVDVAAFTLLQRAVADDVLARVFGILESILYGTTVAGALAAPALVGLFGLNAALVVTGVFLPVLVALAWPLLRNLDVEAPALVERIDLVRGVPFLALLPALTLEHLAGSLEPVHVAAGEAVMQQGESGDRFYVVAEGEVSVTTAGRQIFEGGRGYFFGEIALLRDEPRMATVTARTDLELLALDREEFLGCVTGHTESAQAADAVVAARLGPYRPELLAL